MRGYRSSRERLMWGVIVGLWAGLSYILYGQIGYAFALHMLLNVIVVFAGTAAWLVWKHWGRERYPLPHKPSAE